MYFLNLQQDEDGDVVDVERSVLKHRGLNDVFSRMWQCWSLVAVSHEELGLSPFPISFLLDALCYGKRCVLLDELQLSLLELIRKHCVRTMDGRRDRRREHRRRLRIARKRARKKAERKRAKRPRAEERSNGKEEEDESEEDAESESESEEEEDSESDSESAGDSEEDGSDCEDGEGMNWETAIFTESPFTSFKLDVLREYLHHRCGRGDAADVEAMEVDEEGDGV